MKSLLQILIASIIIFNSIMAQTLYVDPKLGNDTNEGSKEQPFLTIEKALKKLNNNPQINKLILKEGLYVLNNKVIVGNKNNPKNGRILIESEIVPGDTNWHPNKMPTIISVSPTSKNFGFENILGFDIVVNQVTIKGLKFLGNPLPETYYYPVARQDSTLTDLEITQCMFIGDPDALPIQGGILAHGNKIVTDHCIFKNCQNNVILWKINGDKRTGCEIKYTIMDGAKESAVWLEKTDEDFVFKNNIVRNSENFWVYRKTNKFKYTLTDSYIVQSNNYLILYDKEFKISSEKYNEVNINKDHKIILSEKQFLTVPKNYLHPLETSKEFKLNAGLFYR